MESKYDGRNWVRMILSVVKMSPRHKPISCFHEPSNFLPPLANRLRRMLHSALVLDSIMKRNAQLISCCWHLCTVEWCW